MALPLAFSQEGGSFPLPENCYPGMADGLKNNQQLVEIGLRELTSKDNLKKVSKQDPE